MLCSLVRRCQHVFVDPDMPHDTYRSTYNCLDCFYNRLTYQDGYHILHHSNAKTHWSDVPQTFLNKLDDHDNRDGKGQTTRCSEH